MWTVDNKLKGKTVSDMIRAVDAFRTEQKFIYLNRDNARRNINLDRKDALS